MRSSWLLALISASAILVVVKARRLRGSRGAVLVIGGTGLMGAPTATMLQQQGRRVVVMSRGHDAGQGTGGRRPPPPVGCETIVCDRTDTNEFIEALCAQDCVSSPEAAP
jgi:nucleoside-diphosphate-sugar epimerase